jgi:hypothetical protein
MTHVELPDADGCRGAAGSYKVMHDQQAVKVLDRKMENLRKTCAEILTMECPGGLSNYSTEPGEPAWGSRFRPLVNSFGRVIQEAFPTL